ncbi:hypothetical protein AMJ86_09975, partial [bacterium SM23_57]
MKLAMIYRITNYWLLAIGLVWAGISFGGEDAPPKKLPGGLVGERYASSSTILDNGMEVVLIENHANPMIACFVIVRSGQRDETEDIAGVGHFLEHAIFDGTEYRSKKELYDAFDFLGSYVNASTKRDYTEFFILSPKENFVSSLDLLREMIFHSVFPPDTLEQERGIVLEEIKRDLDRPSEKADNLFYRLIYKGTPYAHSILGSVAGISAMPRSAVLDFYETHYVPNNMICVVIGDFQPQDMSTIIDSTFDRYPPGKLAKKELLDLSSLFSTSANHIIKYRSDVDKYYLRVGIEAPTVWSEDYYAMLVWTEILEPYLQKHLIMPQDSSIISLGLDYVEDRDFASLNFYIDVGSELLVDRAVDRLFQSLATFPYWISEERVSAAIQSKRSRDLLQGQRLHMYGLLNSRIFARGGYALWRYRDEYLGKVTLNDVLQSADKYMSYPSFVASCLVPFSSEMTEGAVETTEDVTVRKTLGNGMKIIVHQDGDAPIFAAHLLAKGRSAREGPHRAGYVDLIHRILATSLPVPNASLEDLVQQIGAEFETTDNPYIPYDDYRTSPTHSFLRMECLDGFRDNALSLLSEIVTLTPIGVENLQRAKTEQLGILSSRNARVSYRADRLFLTTMLGADHPLAQPEFGMYQTIESATAEAVASFYNMYFSGSNLILTVVTSKEPEEIIDMAASKFISLPQCELEAVVWRVPRDTVGYFEEEFGKKQSAVRLGMVLRSIVPEDRAALEVWNR